MAAKARKKPSMPESTERTFVIIGAGIAGLTLALALAKAGATVTILERNNAIQEFGAGLQVSPNARYALNDLGLDADIASVSLEPEGIDVYPFKSATPLMTMQLGDAARQRFGVPYAVMHRADLAQTLYRAAIQRPEIQIQFSVESFSTEQMGNQLTITVGEPGKDATQLHPFALIGADGVGSITRTMSLGGPAAKYSGLVAWRTLIELKHCAPFLATDRTSLLWGPGFHAVAYPLPHRGQVNVALFNHESTSVGFGIRDTPNLPKVVTDDPRFSAILQMAKVWTHWPLATVTTNQWHNGSIGLIGDAVHAMLPFQAQGAAMAIEDAVTLAPLLVNSADADSAFSTFKQVRQTRVNKVVKLSAGNANIFHMRPPLSYARDFTVRSRGPLNHFDRLAWLYDFNPVSDK